MDTVAVAVEVGVVGFRRISAVDIVVIVVDNGRSQYKKEKPTMLFIFGMSGWVNGWMGHSTGVWISLYGYGTVRYLTI